MGVKEGTAPERAELAATGWRATVHAQQGATSDHSDFYRLAADMVDTLRSLRSLSLVLARQADRYDVGRALYDDTGTIDARERLDLAVLELQDLASVLDTAGRHADRFHSEIGHVGRGPEGPGDLR